MDILSYLSALIQTRKIVGIAGLGTVYKKKLPGRYDAETHSFVPPSYTLHFTTEIKEDISLPAYISKQRNVSADTSNYFITEFSEGILQELNDHQEAHLGDLGKLVKTDGQLIFEPAEQVNYGFDFYGLPNIKADDKAEEPGTNQPTGDTDAVPAETEVTAEEIIPELQDVEEVTTEESKPEEIADEQPEESIRAAEHSVQDTVPAKPLQQAPLIEEYQEEPVPEDTTENQAEITEPEQEILPEPEELPTMASVTIENERVEENPGDEEKYSSDENTGLNRKDEHQLRAEIEALNFYRSQSPVSKPSIPEQEEVISKLNQEPAYRNAGNSLAEPVAPYTPQPEPENNTTPLFLKIIMGLLILAVMMAAAYFVKPEWFNSITGKTTAPAEKKIQQDVVVPAPSVTDSLNGTDTLNRTPAPVVKKDTLAAAAIQPAATTAATDTTTVYEIIGASMHDQKEADGFIALMKRSGIHAKVVTNSPGKRLKMSIATLKDEESAILERDRLRKKLNIPEIYIYRNKQK